MRAKSKLIFDVRESVQHATVDMEIRIKTDLNSTEISLFFFVRMLLERFLSANTFLSRGNKL